MLVKIYKLIYLITFLITNLLNLKNQFKKINISKFIDIGLSKIKIPALQIYIVL